MKRNFVITLITMLLSPAMWAQRNEEAGLSPLFVPELKAELPEEVHETSGLFFHNGRLWTHNDSGGNTILYGIDTATFEVVQRLGLANAKNKDWEDVCIDGESVFVGDFGNNKGSRDKLRIYTFPLADIPTEGDAFVRVDTIKFRFGDQTDFTKRKEHDFDCEAMFATEEYLYLLSKGWETGTTRLYRLSKKPGNQVAEVVNGFDSQGLVTGADYDRESKTLVVVGYSKPLYKPFLYLIYDFDEAGERLSHRRLEMPQWSGAQTEGICFFDKGKCFISAESTPAFTARVFVADFNKLMNKDLKNK